MYDYLFVNGNELLKKLKKLARLKNVRLKLIKKHGKGSHSTLYFGNDKTTIKDLKKELGAGLLKSMLADLNLAKKDIE